MSAKAKVLFVDDEERVVNLLRMVFRADYEVFTAISGSDALQLIDKHVIDVIVSDQRMPQMMGIDLLKEVRKRSPGTMRILLTGYSDLAAIVGSVNDGEVFRFMNKPWDHEEIKQIMAQTVEAARATRDAAVAQAMETSPPSSFGHSQSSQFPDLLFLDDSPADRTAMAQLFVSDYHVHGASTVAEALKVLENYDVGVIVAEARVGGSDTGQLLRILKQQYPAITTVMLTNSADADLVIKLINQAQIFRFATKPIRAGAFQLAVSAAMKEHQRFRANPILVKRHQVAASAEPDNASLVANVMRSLGGLRSRLSRMMH
jgi:DNA-binding NtrC family response regulator